MFSYQIKSLLVDSRNVFGFYFIYLIFWLRKYPIISNYRSHYTDKWSVEGNLMKCPTAEAKAINIYLDILNSKVYEYQQQLIRENELVNVENIHNKLLGVEKRNHMLVAIFGFNRLSIQLLLFFPPRSCPEVIYAGLF